jgi:hypothetical protein
MVKKILHKIWNFSLKKGWDWIWSKTLLDEKIIDVVEETMERTQRVKEEIQDVKKEVNDLVDAVKGKPRRGRPKIKKQDGSK